MLPASRGWLCGQSGFLADGDRGPALGACTPYGARKVVAALLAAAARAQARSARSALDGPPRNAHGEGENRPDRHVPREGDGRVVQAQADAGHPWRPCPPHWLLQERDDDEPRDQ